MDPDVNLELSRQACIDLVAYRADKRFKIFSWASSLLFGTVAARAFFSANTMSQQEQWLLALTVLVLASYSMAWLHWNSRALKAAVQLMLELEARLNVVRPSGSHEPNSLYEFTVGLLALLALVTTLGPGLLW